MNSSDTLTIHTLWEDILTVLKRRKRLVWITALATALSVYVGLLFVSDQYDADASLLVTIGRENSEVPLTVERGTVFTDGVKKEEVVSYIAMLTSPPVISAAIEEVGMDRFKRQPDNPKNIIAWVKSKAKAVVRAGKEAMNELLIRIALRPRLSEQAKVRMLVEKNLKAYREKDSSVITLSLRLTDPVLAKDVLKAVINQYLQRHSKIVRHGDTLVQMFDDQAQSYGKKLAVLREDSANLKHELGVSSVAEQKAHLLEMVKSAKLGKQENERELARLNAEQQAITKRRPQLEEQLVGTIVVSPSVSQTRARDLLAELNLKRAQAIAKYDAKAEPLLRIEQEIAEIQALTNAVAAEDNGPKTLMRNPVLSQLDLQQEENQVRIAALQAAVKASDSQVEQLTEDLRKMDSAETELQKLQLEINVAEARYVAIASKREEARTQQIMDQQRLANVSVLSEPTYTEKPAAPKRLLIMGLGIVAGIMVGIGLGLFLEWQSDLIYDSRDLERIASGTYLGTFDQGYEHNGNGKARQSRLSGTTVH